MNLQELKDSVNSIYEHLPKYINPEKISIKITLDEPSIGARASTELRCLYEGIDWESGQIRLEPTDKIIRKVYKYNETYKEERQDKNRKTHYCRNCMTIVGVKDKFCKHCGRKFKN